MKWNQLVANSPFENIFMYSWYLDAVADNWCAVFSQDLKTIFPITYTTKVGVSQFHQALFTREFNVIGKDFTIQNVIPALQNRFKMVQFRSIIDLTDIKDKEQRVYQSINLDTEFKNDYSTNAKRLIKKANKSYTYKKGAWIDELMDLVNTTVAHKIKEFTPENLVKLKNLMTNAVNDKKGEVIAVFENDKIVAAGFFLKDKSRITYLKGASLDTAKKNGAMYGLMDFAFNTYKENYKTFDFGGSSVESVAVFYKKFGGIDNYYFNYTINNLPLWFKTLKKLKK